MTHQVDCVCVVYRCVLGEVQVERAPPPCRLPYVEAEAERLKEEIRDKVGLLCKRALVIGGLLRNRLL